MTATIGFGGGCHWCTEAVFDAIGGVSQVSQGYIQSTLPFDSFSEAVVVWFDPGEIPLEVLIEIHLRTHSSTSNHKMRDKYRSAIYVFSAAQSEAAETALTRLQSEFSKPLVTQVLPYVAFKASDDTFTNYGAKNANGPFCVRHIDPKLKLLREKYGDWVKAS
ncbi:MAG: peptide-methionine (S)-S-oxide reductase [Paracoccaceae bacterium]|jgi:peptide-methionine (S)-S-oxide reductase